MYCTLFNPFLLLISDCEEAHRGKQAQAQAVPCPGDDEQIQDDTAAGPGGGGEREGETERESQENISQECTESECCELMVSLSVSPFTCKCQHPRLQEQVYKFHERSVCVIEVK